MVMTASARAILLLRLSDIDAHVAVRTVVAARRILVLDVLTAVRRLLRNHGLNLANVVCLAPENIGLLR